MPTLGGSEVAAYFSHWIMWPFLLHQQIKICSFILYEPLFVMHYFKDTF
jgi:hypothetical protein